MYPFSFTNADTNTNANSSHSFLDGWARNQISNFPGASDDGFKMRALNLIYSVQTVMKIPLILMNTIVIAAELVF